MSTNYIVPIDERDRGLLCSYHRAGCAENSDADWNAYRLHSLRLEEISRIPTGGSIALDQAEFELLGQMVPA